MNVDFLREGSDDRPIIRLYDGQFEDYNKLIESLNNLLINGITFDVLKLQGFHNNETISSFIIEKVDEYKQTTENPKGVFRSFWTENILSDVIIRITKYQNGPQLGHYWLDDETLDIDVLLSHSGRW